MVLAVAATVVYGVAKSQYLEAAAAPLVAECVIDGQVISVTATFHSAEESGWLATLKTVLLVLLAFQGTQLPIVLG